MARQEINEKLDHIKKDLMKQLKLEEIVEEKDLAEEYGLDSLDFVTLVSDIEDEFGIEIDMEEAKELRSFALIREYLLNMLENGNE